jgi:hypothetical protein
MRDRASVSPAPPLRNIPSTCASESRRWRASGTRLSRLPCDPWIRVEARAILREQIARLRSQTYEELRASFLDVQQRIRDRFDGQRQEQARSANGGRLVVHPSEPGARLLGEPTQVGEPGSQLILADPRKLCKRVERALEHVGHVVGLVYEFLSLEPVPPLPFIDFTEAGLVEPAGKPGSRVAPAGSRHALDHRADERLEFRRRRFGPARSPPRSP